MTDLLPFVIIGAGIGIALGWAEDAWDTRENRRFRARQLEDHHQRVDPFVAKLSERADAQVIRLSSMEFAEAACTQISPVVPVSVAEMLRSAGYKFEVAHA
jgi:hypothetical protein